MGALQEEVRLFQIRIHEEAGGHQLRGVEGGHIHAQQRDQPDLGAEKAEAGSG